jgi:hypothetical protein
MNIVVSASVAAVLALSITSAFAQTGSSTGAPSQQDRMRACNADVRAQQLKGDARQTFMSTCLRGASSTSPGRSSARATTVPNPTTSTAASPKAHAAHPATTGSTGPQPTAGQVAERTRIQKCGQEWQADKAAGRVIAGQTWPKYWSACDARLKASGQ